MPTLKTKNRAYEKNLYKKGLIVTSVLLAWILLTQLFLQQDAILALNIMASFLVLFFFINRLSGSSLKLGQLNLPSFFILAYIVILFIPSGWQYVETVDSMRTTFLLAIGSFLVTFPVGVGIANVLLLVVLRITDNSKNTLVPSRLDKIFVPFIGLLFFLSLLIMVTVLLIMPYIPLWAAIQSGQSGVSAMELRFAANELPRSLYFLYELVRRAVMPGLVIYTHFMYVVHGKRWNVISIIVLLFAVSISIFFLDRAPVIILFAAVTLAVLLGKNRSLVDLIRPVPMLVMVIAFVFGGLVSAIQYGGDFSLQRLYNETIRVSTERVFDPINWAFRVFQWFNYSDADFLYGRFNRLFSIFLGQDYIESWSLPFVETGPVSFIADLWRQWGWPGVILGGVTLGCLFQIVDRGLIGGGKISIQLLTIRVVLLGNSFLILYGHAFGVMFTSIFFLSILFTFFIRVTFTTGQKGTSSKYSRQLLSSSPTG